MASTAGAAPPPATRARVDPALALCATLVALPFVVGAVALLAGSRADFAFVGDNAANQLRIADVGSHTPLLGPYSRDGWSHLGPLMYYVLALPYRVLGSRSAGIVVGALAINGACAVGTVLLARRLGGRTLMALVTVALLVLLLSLGPEFMRDPWNPYLVVLPFGALLLAAWALADGSWWMLPVVAGLATFCVQTHVGLLPVAGALAVWSLVPAVAAQRRVTDPVLRRRWRWPALTAAGVLLLAWIPPVVDQVTGTGNLRAAARHLTNGAPRGAVAALRIVGDAFTLWPGWLSGDHATVPISGEPATAFRTPWPWLGVALFAVVALAWRGETRTARLGVGTCGVALGATVVALARTPGLVFDYRLRFVWVLGAFSTAVGAWLLLRLLARARAPRPGTDGHGARRSAVIATGLAASIAVVLGALAVVDQTTPDPPDVRRVERADRLTPGVLAALPRGGPYELRADSFAATQVRMSLALRLEAAGRDVRIAPSGPTELTFGAHRLLHEAPRRVATIVVGPSGAPPRLDGARPVASVGAPPAQRRRNLAELARLGARYPAATRPPAVSRRMARLIDASEVATVFVADRPDGQERGAATTSANARPYRTAPEE